MKDIGDLIKGLGGPKAVAARCGITPPAVTNWCARGEVAAEHRITVWRMAVEAGIDWRPPGADGLALVPVEVA